MADPSNYSIELQKNRTNKDAHDIKVIKPHEKAQQLSGCDLALAVIGASVGNLLEWFDFAMFGLLVNEIGENFFPTENKTAQRLSSFAIFAGAFLTRPVGGVLFGYIGDKYGRLFALRISLFMMAIPTFLTGCLPNYNQIGIFAPLLLTLLRLIQGISVGGEFTGAITYIFEVCPPNQKALYNTLVHVSGSGTILGTMFVGVLRAFFSAKQMTQFAWRIPFLFGVFVALFGVWMRKGLKQSSQFETNKSDGKLLENPIRNVLSSSKLMCKVVMITFHMMFDSAAYYAVFIWLPSYAVNKEVNPVESIYLLNGLNMIVCLICQMICGMIIDKYFESDSTNTLIGFGIILSFYTLLSFPFIYKSNTIELFFIQFFWSLIAGFYHGGWSLWGVSKLDESETRYSTFGIAYNIALAAFGGTAPLLATALVLHGRTWPLGLLLFCYGCVSISTNIVVFCKEKRHKQFDVELDKFDSDHEPFLKTVQHQIK